MQFWFKLTKWDTDKPDFVKIYADSEKEAYYKVEDQLLKHKTLVCEYFSTSSKYRRNIDNIINYEIVDYSEVEKHIDKINYAISKQRGGC